MKYVDYLSTLTDCPFCRSGQRHIAENATAYLTYSAAPYHPDHLLVVPKRHLEHILDISEAEQRDMDALQKVGLAALRALGYENMCVLIKEGDRREKTIAHSHYHLIPDVVLGDTDHTGIDRQMLSPEQVDALLARIRSAIKE